jgi:hypothetical protein
MPVPSPSGTAPRRRPRGRLGRLALALALAVAGCGHDDDARLDEVQALITEGSSRADASRTDEHFNGGPALVVEATFTGTVDAVWAPMEARLTGGGYRTKCPGGRGDAPPGGQENTGEPRRSCRITGHDVDGTIWLSTVPGPEVKVSAIVLPN